VAAVAAIEVISVADRVQHQDRDAGSVLTVGTLCEAVQKLHAFCRNANRRGGFVDLMPVKV
jgi:hypothetical protein